MNGNNNEYINQPRTKSCNIRERIKWKKNSKTIKNLAHLTIYVKMGNNAVKKKNKPRKAYNNKFFKA